MGLFLCEYTIPIFRDIFPKIFENCISNFSFIPLITSKALFAGKMKIKPLGEDRTSLNCLYSPSLSNSTSNSFIFLLSLNIDIFFFLFAFSMICS